MSDETHLQEADRQAPESDHWSDYTKDHGDPYPATQEAWQRSTVDLPSDVMADPDAVRQDAAVFGAAPWRQGTQTRELAAGQWTAGGWKLTDGVQGHALVEYDPYRTRVKIINYSAGNVFVSPTDVRLPGIGTCIIPAATAELVHHVELRTTARVYLFTEAAYTTGAAPISIQVITERYGG